MRLSEAAQTLFSDPRRNPATRLEPVITAAATKIMHSLSSERTIFDHRYSSVGGSVRRGTHLPGKSDFDITLALERATCSGPYRNGEFEPSIKTSLAVYASCVGAALAKDRSVCDGLARLFGTTSADVESRLRASPILKEWPGAPVLAAKFSLANDLPVVEVCLGDAAWHCIGLLHHDVRRKQLDRVTPSQRDLAVSHILVAKLLVKNRSLYGGKHRLPNLTLSSRRIEQFVMQQALKGSGQPFVDACSSLAALEDFGQAPPLLEHPAAPFPPGVTEAQLTVVRPTAESLNHWKAFRKLAQDVASGNMDYACEM